MARRIKKYRLVHEIDEDGLLAEARSSSSEKSFEDSTLLSASIQDGKAPSSRYYKLVAIFVPVTVLFFVLLYAAAQIPSHFLAHQHARLSSNGTASFRQTTILVSLDGFRADFLSRGLTPTLKSFVSQGVSPPYLLPSFPSVTFPNHYTLVTGLFPESHGIVGNSFWDPKFEEEFYYTNRSSSMQAKWWGGEPLWITAEKQGVKTGIHMWPGSEAHIDAVEPTYVDAFNGSELLSRKIDRILELLDLPGPVEQASNTPEQRPQLIAAYVPDVDTDGHKYGPNSTEIQETIKRVDKMLHDLFMGLEERNLTTIVNVIVVSDHGMATTSTDRLIQLDDLVNMDLIEHVDGWPLYGLRPKRSADLLGLYKQLSSRASETSTFDVYLRDKDMPERYHFSRNDRIAPLWIVPKAGWAVVEKKDFDVGLAKQHGEAYRPRGLHGYDHEDPLMRAIFVARGPAFPHQPNSRLEVFQNIEVYNLVCDSLSIEPAANSGTLRLPLKPLGLHSESDGTAVTAPAEPTIPSATSSTSESHSLEVTSPDVSPNRPVIDDESSESGSKLERVWKSVIAKINSIKDWFHGVASTGGGEDSLVSNKTLW